MLKLIPLFILPLAFGQTPLTTAQIAKRVSPSVVVIQGETNSGEVLGSGFIVSKDGKIVTNLHVIKDMKTASVQLANGEIFDSLAVLATDERRDLAVVQIAGFNLPVLDLGDSDALTVGEPLVIVGSPKGLEGTVTAGILSSVRDSGDGFKVVQTDAAMNPGNSGGPLINSKGQVIGVVAFRLQSSEGLNFAVPINYVRGMLNIIHEPMTLDQIRRNLSAAKELTNEQSKGPSLKEALDWLKQKLPLGMVRYATLSTDGDTLYTIRQNKVWSLDSCNIVIGTETQFSTRKYSTPTVSTYRHTFPFGIVKASVFQCDSVRGCPGWLVLPDSGYVAAGGDQKYYIVGLRSASKEILTEGVGMWSFSENVDHFELDFTDESLAKRVAEAFLHAAKLCGAKEPF